MSNRCKAFYPEDEAWYFKAAAVSKDLWDKNVMANVIKDRVMRAVGEMFTEKEKKEWN